MCYERALDRALDEVRISSPYVVAARSGAPFDQGRFKLRLFNRTFYVHHPEIRVQEEGKEEEPQRTLQVLLLHYLLRAKGVPVAEHWVSYRDLPGAYLFEGRFRQMAVQPLESRFGNDLEGFREAATWLEGEPMTRTGDAAFRFLALPRIPMACILFLGEEEIPSTVTILFDASAPHYLPTEDLSILGAYLGGALQSYQRR